MNKIKKSNKTDKATQKLPIIFKPLLWSYNFSRIDPAKNKKTVIVNTINYGDLIHWSWIEKFYGERAIRQLLSSLPASEIRARAFKLASILFSIKKSKINC